jgi:hypothetical protein
MSVLVCAQSNGWGVPCLSGIYAIIGVYKVLVNQKTLNADVKRCKGTSMLTTAHETHSHAVLAAPTSYEPPTHALPVVPVVTAPQGVRAQNEVPAPALQRCHHIRCAHIHADQGKELLPPQSSESPRPVHAHGHTHVVPACHCYRLNSSNYGVEAPYFSYGEKMPFLRSNNYTHHHDIILLTFDPIKLIQNSESEYTLHCFSSGFSVTIQP